MVPESKRRVLLREVNTRIREISDRFGTPDRVYHLVCECGADGCAERLDIPVDEYDELRRRHEFLLVAAHEPRGTKGHARLKPAFVPADAVPLL